MGFFAATTTAAGREPWLTNGTTGGTVQIADVFPGAASSNPGDIIVSAFFEVWFVANDGPHGRELWRASVGVPSTATRMTDIVAGVGSNGPRGLVNILGSTTIVFTTSTDPPQLWAVSTSGSSPILLKTFRSGPAGMRQNLTLGMVAFAAEDSSTGVEPWRTDGTVLGTQSMGNIAPDTGGPFADLKAHIDPSGTQWTLCIDDGPPNGLGIIAVSTSAPTSGVPLGILTGPLFLASLDLVSVVFLDANGDACTTYTIPGGLSGIDLVAQGFTVDPSTFYPFSSSDLTSLGIPSLATSSLFGGTARSVGVYRDRDHRYEVSVHLPAPGTGQDRDGLFVVKYRKTSGELIEVEEDEHRYQYEGIGQDIYLGPGCIEGSDIKGIEVWFRPNSGTGGAVRDEFVWKSYC